MTATTTTNYFANVTTSADITTIFLQLSRDFSVAMVDFDPAFKGADAATLHNERVRRQALTVDLNTQFQRAVLAVVPDEMTARRQATLDAQGQGKTVQPTYQTYIDDVLKGYGKMDAVLQQIVHLTHCKIEIIGCWIYVREWVDADADTLDKAGFHTYNDTDELGNRVRPYRWAGTTPRKHLKGIDNKKRIFGFTTVNDPAA